MENGRVLKTEHVQSTKRTGSPSAYFRTRDCGSGTLAKSLRQKTMKVLPKERFKLLQAAIVSHRPGEIPSSFSLPSGKKFLQSIPMSAEILAFVFWFQRRRRIGTVPVDAESRIASFTLDWVVTRTNCRS